MLPKPGSVRVKLVERDEPLPRLAEHQLTAILARLGITTWTEAARVATRPGITTEIWDSFPDNLGEFPDGVCPSPSYRGCRE